MSEFKDSLQKLPQDGLDPVQVDFAVRDFYSVFNTLDIDTLVTLVKRQDPEQYLQRFDNQELEIIGSYSPQNLVLNLPVFGNLWKFEDKKCSLSKVDRRQTIAAIVGGHIQVHKLNMSREGAIDDEVNAFHLSNLRIQPYSRVIGYTVSFYQIKE